MGNSKYMSKNKFANDRPTIPVVKNIIFEKQLKIIVPNKFKKLVVSFGFLLFISFLLWIISLVAGETVAASTIELNDINNVSYKIINEDGSISRIPNSFYKEAYKTIKIGDLITRYPISTKEDRILWIENLIKLKQEVKEEKKNSLKEKIYSILGNKTRAAIVYKYAKQYNIPVFLVVGVIFAESSNIPSAISSAGARGLMQLMPDTAVLIARKWRMGKTALKIRKAPEILNINEELNIKFGCAHLKDLYNKIGHWEGAVHSYNQGFGRYMKGYRSNNYVNKVLNYWSKFKSL